MMEYHHSAIKRNEVLIQATTLVNPENNTLSERIKTQKATYHMIPIMFNVQNREIHRDRDRLSSWPGHEE